MIEIVGVRFRDCGRIHYFKSGKYILQRGDLCWVETARGNMLGMVVAPTVKAHPSTIPVELPKVLSMAGEEEKDEYQADVEREKQAFETCLHYIHQHELPMKLVRCNYINNGKKVIFFFTAEGRVDFRGLLKDLAREFKIRIELRQIGVRDEAKILGGLASCGRTLCCATWIDEFRPVSIKMAKQQNLSLDPQKISGICGRLKCCLAYEADPTGEEAMSQNKTNGKKKQNGECYTHCRCPRPYDSPM